MDITAIGNGLTEYQVAATLNLHLDGFSSSLGRSSCPEVFCEKGVLRNFAKFTGRHLCQSLLIYDYGSYPQIVTLHSFNAELYYS